MKSWVLSLLLGSLASAILTSCGSQDALKVKQFTLREVDPLFNDDDFLRGERQKRLYGAISQEERADRIGQYYSVRWRANPTGEEVRVRFDYRQAASGSRIQSLEHRTAAASSGFVEFTVTGESYRKSGRVLAWRMQLYQGEDLLSEETSYLWN